MRDRYPTLSVRLKRASSLAGAWLLVLAGGVFGGEAAAEPGVRVAPAELTVREGQTGSYTAVLVTQPRAEVTIALGVPEGASVRVEPASLTFTTENWSTPQTVRVTAPEDADAAGGTHGIDHMAWSGDRDYFGLFMDLIAVTVLDNDTAAPGVWIHPSKLTVREGESGSYAVVLGTQPTAGVTVGVAAPEGASVRVEPASLTFTTENWSTPQRVTVSEPEDADRESEDHALTHSAASADGDYNGVGVAGVALRVVDDDEGQVFVRIDPNRLTIEEGESGSYTVVLGTQPTAEVTIGVEVPRGSRLRAEPFLLTFTTENWNTPQTVTVTALEDPDQEDPPPHIMSHRSLSRDREYSSAPTEWSQITVIDDDGPGVRVAPEQLTVREGQTGSYTAVLVTQPRAEVTIALGVPEGASVRVEPASLTFTTENWSTPQTVRVTAPEDADAAGGTHGIDHMAWSGDRDYFGLFMDLIAVTVLDNDTAAPGVWIHPSKLTVREGESGSYAVVLGTQPTAGVTVGVAAPEGASVRVEPASLTFTTENWSTPQRVTVSEPEDADRESEDHALTHSAASADGDYNGVGVAGVALRVVDDDEGQVFVRIDPNRLTIEEGESGSYTVVLGTQPTAEVTIGVEVPRGSRLRAEPFLLTFTTENWNTPQTVTVTALEDPDQEDPPPHIMSHRSLSRDREYSSAPTEWSQITVIDDDGPGVRVAPEQLTVREGQTGSYTAVLVTQPRAEVTIALGVPEGASVRVEPASLTFTTENWSMPQTVTVTALEDDNAMHENHTLTHSVASTDRDYNEVSVDGIALRIVDDEAPGVRIVPEELTVWEGEAGSYTAVLVTRPTADVTVRVAAPEGARLRVEPSSLAFTTENWSMPQTVTVTALEDDNAMHENHTLTHSVASTDRDYNEVSVDGIALRVVDDEAPGVRIAPEELTVREGEAGSYTAVLVTRPTADVTVGVAAPEGASVRVEPSSLTFTTENWSMPQTVTVTALQDDNAIHENHTLTHSVASTDPDYNEVSVDGIALRVVDTAPGAPGVSIDPLQLTINEGETGTYTAVLTALPTHPVTVVMEPPSDGKLSVSPESLTFTTENWSAAQTVRVTAHEDGDKADGTMSLGHRIESTDENYQGVAAASLQVGVTDDDDLEVRVAPTGLTIAEGGEGSYTLVMVEEPPRGLTVTVENPDRSKLRISPETVEFTSGENGNWNQAQTVTVTALQDTDAVSEKLRITHEAAFAAGTVTGKEYIYMGSRLLAIEPGGGVAPQLSFDDVRVEITDDETSAAGLTVSPGRLAIAHGHTGSYTVAPNIRPTHPEALTLGGSPDSDNVAGTSISSPVTAWLSFTRSNWNRPRRVGLPVAADAGSGAHFGATRGKKARFGTQPAAIASGVSSSIVALAPLHLPERESRVTANSQANNGVTVTGNPFHRERDEAECEAPENCPENDGKEGASPPVP